MVQSNKILYQPGEKPDHCVVIKYVPYVGMYLLYCIDHLLFWEYESVI